MSGGSIFFESGDNLEALVEAGFGVEEILQKLLAKHSTLLAGLAGGTTGGEAKRLLLVKREMGVPTSPGGSPTFSADHLFVDPDGVPVVVEVKLKSDTRIRREVVGQMLDYAANGRRYWPAASLSAAYEATRAAYEQEAKLNGEAADQALAEHAPGGKPDDFWDKVEMDPADFWAKVENNLKDGRVRLVFVADHIPAELAAIIEFLNEQMNPAEVLGVEVLRYRAEESGQVAYVPRLIGATATAVATKRPDGGGLWPPDRFIEEAKRRCGPKEVAKLETLLAHVDRHHGRVNPGQGASPSVSGAYPLAGGPLLTVWNANFTNSPTIPSMWFNDLGQLKERAPSQFDKFVKTLEAITALKGKMAQAREVDWTGKYPTVKLTDLTEAELASILTAIDGLLPGQHG